ncbi:DUF1289 domain-containing protein [Photobacterium sp. GB-36]|uniref:DUF1289 domain-containing protein n=1 Tax=Photobacterium sp. GB-36 TaxID=2022108 RepID=UPI000D15779A|nr:DUF1289 domain-containing protein [Photobacterium sp. GB-36]PSV43523.1 DUF1289 domain-containing protein [Photobacterium sp. GB-36]
MEQKDFFDIPSPCKRICEVNNKGYCKGCFRSREERLYWLKMTDDEKHLVLDICRRRKQQVLRRHRAKLQQELDKNIEREDDPQQSLF